MLKITTLTIAIALAVALSGPSGLPGSPNTIATPEMLAALEAL